MRNQIDNQQFVISLSFGNYLKSDGGVDKAISEQNKMFNEANISYLQIAPIGLENKLCIFGKYNGKLYTLVQDGKYCGVFDEYGIGIYLDETSVKSRLIAIFLHHMKKFDMEFLMQIISNTKIPVYFFLHDYYSICEHPNLLRNKNKFCGVNKKDAEQCRGCIYADELVKHYNNTKKILNSAKELYVISPSEICLQIWRKTYGEFIDLSKCLIFPHQKLYGSYDKFPQLCGKIKIGFIGKYGGNKGRYEWEKIVNYINEKGLPYEMYYFGISDLKLKNVKRVAVKVTSDKPYMMIDMMRKMQINCAFLWSICPETYSYTYFEAFASNAYIITNQDSGNIAAMVAHYNNGRICKNINEFIELLSKPTEFRNELINYCERGNNGPKGYKINQDILQLTINNQSEPEGRINQFLKRKVNVVIKNIVGILYAIKNR